MSSQSASPFSGQFTKIAGISDKRRLPRIGKIRLGGKLISSKSGGKEYPFECPFFLLPSDVARVYGFKSADEAEARAKEMGETRPAVLLYIRQYHNLLTESLDIMFPLEDQGAVAPQAYKRYGTTAGVKCIGNGEIANELGSDNKWSVRACPCEKLKTDSNPRGDCTYRGHILFMIPKVSSGGVYQIDTSSYNAIVDVNSGIALAQEWIKRFSFVPFILRRNPMHTFHNGQKSLHFPLQLIMNVPTEQIAHEREATLGIIQSKGSAYVVPQIEDQNPKLDNENAYVMEIEEVTPDISGSVVNFDTEKNVANNATTGISQLCHGISQPCHEHCKPCHDDCKLYHHNDIKTTEEPQKTEESGLSINEQDTENTAIFEYSQRVKNAASVEELQSLYDDVSKAIKSREITLSAIESKAFSALVKSRKTALLKEREKAAKAALSEAEKNIPMCDTVDAVNAYCKPLEHLFDGEQKVRFAMLRDRRITELREAR